MPSVDAAQHAQAAGRADERGTGRSRARDGRSARTADARRRRDRGTRRGSRACRPSRRGASSPRSRARAGSSPWPPSMNRNASGVRHACGDDRRVADDGDHLVARGRRRGSCAGRTAACPSARCAGRPPRGRGAPSPPGSPRCRGGGRPRTPPCRTRRAAAPSHTVERPQYEPTSRNGRPGTRGTGGDRRVVQRIALVRRHEPLGGERVRAQPRVDRAPDGYQRSQWMIVSAIRSRRRA